MKALLQVSVVPAKVVSVALLLCGACAQPGVATPGAVPVEHTADLTTLEPTGAFAQTDTPAAVAPGTATTLGPASDGVSLHTSTAHPAS